MEGAKGSNVAHGTQSHMSRHVSEELAHAIGLVRRDSPRTSTTSLGSPFQGLTTLSVKKCLLMSNQNLPWHSFKQFPCILSQDTREKRSAPPSPFLLLRKRQKNSPFTNFVVLFWTHSRISISFLNHGAQNSTQYSK